MRRDARGGGGGDVRTFLQKGSHTLQKTLKSFYQSPTLNQKLLLYLNTLAKARKFSPAFFKRPRGGGCVTLLAVRDGETPPSAFLFVSFFFAPLSAKEKAEVGS